MARKNRILLRADGNSEIGLGHVYRCFSIAERLKNKFDFYFAIQNPSKEIISLLEKHSKLIILSATTSSLEEAKQVSILSRNYDIRIVLLDGYAFSTDYQKLLKDSGFKIVSIDDDQPFHYVSDIVINHSPGVATAKIQAEPYTKIYTGLDYALLRKPFIKAASKDKIINSIKNVFICFGGADPNNITKKVLSACIDTKFFAEINVLIGSAYLFSDLLDSIAEEYGLVKLHKDLDGQQMISLMQKCQLAIVPASSIAMEAFLARLLLLTGTTADNQQDILNGLSQYETIKSISDFNTLDKEMITDELVLLFENFKPITIRALNNSINGNLTSVFNTIL